MEDVSNWSIIDSRNCRNAPVVRHDCPYLKEADRRDMNCGGYALGTLDWYCPDSYYDREDFDFWDDSQCFYDNCNSSEYYHFCDKLAEIYVDDMLNDPHSNVIREVDNPYIDLESDERIVAFRASAEDFHYIRQMSDGSWSHKQGGLAIEEFPEEALDSFVWEGDCELYGGRTHYLVVKDNTLVA